MPRSTNSFKQADVTRAVKAALAAGLTVSGIEISEAKFRIVTTDEPVESENEWDEVLS